MRTLTIAITLLYLMVSAVLACNQIPKLAVVLDYTP
jgi:hypothetical protein